MLRDLRHGLRTLMRDKGWTTVVVISLAIGIGANTALFGAINGLFLEKLDVRDPDSLVRLKWAGPNDMVTDSSDYGFSRRDPSGLQVRSTFSYPMYRQFLADNRTMDEVFACAPNSRVNLVIDGQAEIASALATSGNYYRTLGLTANPGRTILPDDDRPDAPPVAVISPRYWRSRFGGDPAAIGKTVRFNGVPVTIVGVVAPDLYDVQRVDRDARDIAIPISLVSQIQAAPPSPGEPPVPLLERPTYWWLQIMGRLKPGVTAAQVQANLESVFQHTARSGFDAYLASLSADARGLSHNRNRTHVPHLRVEPGNRGIYDVNTSDERAVTILSVVAILILLIVCANVANLLLSRAATRQKELSVRLSLGATRMRLVGQLLAESLLLAAMGGAAGIFVGRWGQQLLPTSGTRMPFDWRVLGFVLGITIVSGVVFGIAPALRATGMNVSATLKESSRSVAGSRSILSRSLLVLQVAISLMLLVAAGLFLRTLQNLRHVDAGFNTENVLLFRVSPSLNRYDDAHTLALYEQLLDRLRAVAGVRSVALANVSLLSGSVNSTSIFVSGRTYAQGQRDSINRLAMSAGFFETMHMPVLLGRGLTERDTQSSAKVAVINEAAAKKYFPGENPIGRRFGSTIENAGQIEVVGVLRDAKYDSVREPAPPTEYVPYLQARGMGSVVFHLRTAGDPQSVVGAVREAVRATDANLPLMNVSTQAEQVEQRLTQERIFAEAYTIFGAIALLIASVGLFGLMSYSVARRTSEIGIRMALGAQRADVVRLVLGESMMLVAVGVVLGLVAALAAGRLVATFLFGLAPTDVATIAAAVFVMAAVSGVAGYLPARRASRVDPLIALHYE